MKIFAMSDIHGSPVEFEEALELVDLSGDNLLILCGDYIHGYDSYTVLDRIIGLQNEYGSDKVIALMGNHEEMAMNGMHEITYDEDIECDEVREDRYLRWMHHLPLYYKTDTQIFVHAGVCEEAGEEWKWSTADFEYTEQFPARTGKFCMDIIAGHVGTYSIANNPHFHDIYYDSQSHYYIDGTVLKSGVIPVLMYDTDTKKYYQMREFGAVPVLPYDEEY
jgi:serine/threonine protein phosphatase 1